MAENEVEISELEYTQELAGDNLFPVESATDTKATSLQILKDWLSSFFVGKTGNEDINGVKNFINSPTVPTANVSSNDKTVANTSFVTSKTGLVLPIGAIVPFGGSTAPTGYLLCNGSAVSRTTYAKLFDAIGTTYGSGDGSKTFNLPNLSSARMVTSSTVSVKGNGKTFNLTDGTNTVSIKSSSYNLQIGAYTANINTGISGGTINNGNSLGVSKDTSKSGITGTASLATSTRFIIKY